jgi:hypothetical protein
MKLDDFKDYLHAPKDFSLPEARNARGGPNTNSGPGILSGRGRGSHPKDMTRDSHANYAMG